MSRYKSKYACQYSKQERPDHSDLGLPCLSRLFYHLHHENIEWGFGIVRASINPSFLLWVWNHILLPIGQIWCPLASFDFCHLTLIAAITTAADDKFCDIFPNFQKKIRYDISWESSARFSWIIMPYLLFLKKRQNLKSSSAANYRWHILRVRLYSLLSPDVASFWCKKESIIECLKVF